jgi:hypothetical protein
MKTGIGEIVQQLLQCWEIERTDLAKSPAGLIFEKIEASD